MRKPPKTRRPAWRLEAPGWSEGVRERLERILRRYAGRSLPVVFDFDNTIVCGDIGEATLAQLARDGVLAPDRVPPGASPEFTAADGRRIALGTSLDPTAYYEDFLAPTAHGDADPTPLANGYVWAAAVMAGLPVARVVQATAAVWAESVPGARRLIEVTPGKTAYPVPFFYPEIVELIAALRRCEFEVWVVSASNVWSVRWMITHALNPLLRAGGVRRGIPPEQVIGVSLLLQDAEGRLFKDRVHVRRDRAYAALDEAATSGLRLTSQLEFPAPTYAGKVACIWDYLGRPPVLCAGDSPGDHAMLSFSEHRLWIARLEKPDYLAATLALTRRTGPANWLFQPAQVKQAPGFLASLEAAAHAKPPPSESVRRSLRLLRRLA